MKLDSPLFNRIRVKPVEEPPRPRVDAPACEWPGCASAGTHRAPKGRMREREYWRFCLEHVRDYNQSYNYFAGMSEDAVARYQKDAVTGHRPTWKMGMNGGSERYHGGDAPMDPFDVMREFGGSRTRPERPKPEARPVHNVERKAFETLGLETDAPAGEIKARFKELVKRHHPDANGGDRSTEDHLVAVIQAYNHLKAAKFC
jgi:hypothetical protein